MPCHFTSNVNLSIFSYLSVASTYFTIKIRFKVDVFDGTVMSQTTISVNVAFEKI